MPKTFVLIIDDAPDTKWLFDDALISRTIQYCAATVCASDSTGPRPQSRCVVLCPKDADDVREIVRLADAKKEQAQNEPETPKPLAFLSR